MMGLDLRELPVAQGGQDFDLQLIAVLFQRPGLQLDLGVLREPPLGKFLESGLFTGQDLPFFTRCSKARQKPAQLFPAFWGRDWAPG